MLKEGYRFTTHQGYDAVIVKYNKSTDIDICIDGDVIVKTRQQHIRSGKIKNPMVPSVFSVGCMGLGEFNKKEHEEAYLRWQRMLERCYGKPNSTNGCYTNTIVCKDWLNFQNFARWLYGVSNYRPDFQLDKDLLGDGTVYSPDNCCFLPPVINSTLSWKGRGSEGVRKRESGSYQVRGCYKGKRVHLKECSTYEEGLRVYYDFKENYMKELAEEYKQDIPEKAYSTLASYNSSF